MVGVMSHSVKASPPSESVRFVTPQVYRLDRLEMSVVPPLLDRLTGVADDAEPVILHPERGWETLKERLADHLVQEGAVLPIQMKIALQGLASLRWLAVGEYRRRGGLTGLMCRSAPLAR